MKNQLHSLRNLGALLLATAALTTSALAGPDTQAFLKRTYTTLPDYQQVVTPRNSPTRDKKQVATPQRAKAVKFTASPKALVMADSHPTLLTAGDSTVTVWRN